MVFKEKKKKNWNKHHKKDVKNSPLDTLKALTTFQEVTFISSK
jgi:hypothetical protein